MANIYHIVLTGGQCGGKTQALPFIKDKLEAKGYHVFVVPETASQLISAGFDPYLMPKNLYKEFQYGILEAQLGMEKAVRNLILLKDNISPIVVLYDRGLADGRAYCTEQDFDTAVDRVEELTYDGFENICSDIYDAVIHMETTAKHANLIVYETHQANNPNRVGDRAWAIKTDDALLKAWDFMDERHHIVKNDGNWDDKLYKTLRVVYQIVGANKDTEIERKWLVDDFSYPNDYTEHTITQTYLKHDFSGCERVRRSMQVIPVPEGQGIMFTHTRKCNLQMLTRTEDEREITQEEYYTLLKRADPSRKVVLKHRLTFDYKGQTFELDKFFDGGVILECELADADQPVQLPPFVKVVMEVSEDWNYCNHAISLYGFPKFPS